MATPRAQINLVVGKALAFKGSMLIVEGILSKVRERMLGVTKAAGLMLAGLVAGSAGFVSSFARQEEAMVRLRAVIRATGGAAGVSATQMEQYAQELQKITGLADEVTINMQAVLATFKNVRGDVFREATLAIADMAAVLGTNLQGAAIQLGKALNDPIRGITALMRVGVSFTKAQRGMIKTLAETGDIVLAQKLILRELQEEFGGAAEALGKTVAGQLRILREEAGDLNEEIGKALVPTVIDLREKISELIPLIKDWVKANNELLASLVFTTAKVLVFITGLSLAAAASVAFVSSMVAATASLFILKFALPIITTTNFWKVTTLAWKAMLLLGGAVKSVAASLIGLATSPVGLVLAGLAALTAATILYIRSVREAERALEDQAEASRKFGIENQKFAGTFREPPTEQERIASAQERNIQRSIDFLQAQQKALEGSRRFIDDFGTRAANRESQAGLQVTIDKLKNLLVIARETTFAIAEQGTITGRTADEVAELVDKLELQRAVLGQTAEMALRVKLAFKGYNAEQIETIANVKALLEAEKEELAQAEDRWKQGEKDIEQFGRRKAELEREVRALQRGLGPEELELLDLSKLGASRGELNQIVKLLERRRNLLMGKELQDEADALEKQMRTKAEILAAEKEHLELLRKRTDLDEETFQRRLKQLEDEAKVTMKQEARVSIGTETVAAAIGRISAAAANTAADQTAANTGKALTFLQEITEIARAEREEESIKRFPDWVPGTFGA